MAGKCLSWTTGGSCERISDPRDFAACSGVLAIDQLNLDPDDLALARTSDFQGLGGAPRKLVAEQSSGADEPAEELPKSSLKLQRGISIT